MESCIDNPGPAGHLARQLSVKLRPMEVQHCGFVADFDVKSIGGNTSSSCKWYSVLGQVECECQVAKLFVGLN